MDGSSIFRGTNCQFFTSSGAVLASSDHSIVGQKSLFFLDNNLKSYFDPIYIKPDGSREKVYFSGFKVECSDPIKLDLTGSSNYLLLPVFYAAA